MGEWRDATWGDLATLEYGRALRGYQNQTGPYRVYGTNGPIGYHTEYLYEGPSVIVGRKGAYRGIHYAPDPFFVIDTAFYLKPKVPLDLRWAYYELLTHNINDLDSGSAIPSTSRETFYALPVKVPSLDEQRAIAAVLGTLDDKIESNRRMNKKLEAMARAIFRDWFVDFGPTRAKMEGREPYLAPEIWDLFPDRLDDEGKPEGWRTGTVGNCFHLTMGQSPPGSTYNNDGNGLPFFQGSTDFGFRYPEERKFCTAAIRTAERDDTLVSVRAPVGAINMAWQRCCVGRGVAALRHKSGSRSFTYYSAWAIQKDLQRYEQMGTVFGAITKKQFEALKTIEPTQKLIDLFETCVGPIDERIRANFSESRTLAQIRDLLLPKLMSGEIRVREAEKEVEAVS